MPSIGNLEQELLGIWEDSSGGVGGDGWPGEKRGRKARRGGGSAREWDDEGGAISRAVSDENLFDSLFGDQRGDGVGEAPGGTSELAGNCLYCGQSRGYCCCCCCRCFFCCGLHHKSHSGLDACFFLSPPLSLRDKGTIVRC